MTNEGPLGGRGGGEDRSLYYTEQLIQHMCLREQENIQKKEQEHIYFFNVQNKV